MAKNERDKENNHVYRYDGSWWSTTCNGKSCELFYKARH